MPFTVTTTRPDALDAAHHRLGIATEASSRVVSRRAVATLEEAQAWAHGGMDMFYEAALAIPETGGKVGPLPDGTVIEVEPVAWADLNEVTGEIPMWSADRPITDDVAMRRIIAAFNAAQGAVSYG